MTPTLTVPPLVPEAEFLRSCGDYGGFGWARGGGRVPSEEWLSVGLAAARLGVGLTKMRELTDDPRSALDVMRVGTHRRVSVASIEEFLRVSRIRDPNERELALEGLRQHYEAGRVGTDVPKRPRAKTPTQKALERIDALNLSDDDARARALREHVERLDPPKAG